MHILGAGPAGLTSAYYAKKSKIDYYIKNLTNTYINIKPIAKKDKPIILILSILYFTKDSIIFLNTLGKAEYKTPSKTKIIARENNNKVKILNVTDAISDYSIEVKDTLVREGFRVELNDSSDKIGYKIRQGVQERVPYLIILGKLNESLYKVSIFSNLYCNFNIF